MHDALVKTPHALGPLPIAAAALGAVVDGKPVQRIQLLPFGEFTLRDGRGPFRLEAAGAQAVLDATAAWAGAMELMVDYDHQSFYATGPGKGGRAEAAGWIKGLSIEADGIWGDVEWTEAAAAKLADRRYRYISPLFIAGEGGRVTALRNAGLVNVPAIDGLAPVAASNLETPMELQKIAAALGLPETATLDEILAAIAAMAGSVTAASATLTGVAAALKLPATATPEQLVAAATAAAPDQAKFVPIAAFTELQDQLATFSKERAEAAVAAAMTAGKVTPALKDWASGFAERDLQGFTGWVEKAPVIVAAGTQLDADAGATGAGTITPEEAAVLKLTGVSPENFLKAKKG